MSTTTLTTVSGPVCPAYMLGSLSRQERQHFKNSYRRSCALDAGANPAQLQTLQALEKGFNSHYPVYKPDPAGTITAKYTAPETGTITAHIHPDGTLRINA